MSKAQQPNHGVRQGRCIHHDKASRSGSQQPEPPLRQDEDIVGSGVPRTPAQASACQARHLGHILDTDRFGPHFLM
jgi:hypothetical protein